MTVKKTQLSHGFDKLLADTVDLYAAANAAEARRQAARLAAMFPDYAVSLEGVIPEPGYTIQPVHGKIKP